MLWFASYTQSSKYFDNVLDLLCLRHSPTFGSPGYPRYQGRRGVERGPEHPKGGLREPKHVPYQADHCAEFRLHVAPSSPREIKRAVFFGSLSIRRIYSAMAHGISYYIPAD